LAAPAGNLQLGTDAGSGPVVPALTPMTAATATAGPGLLEDFSESGVHLRGS